MSNLFDTYESAESAGDSFDGPAFDDSAFLSSTLPKMPLLGAAELRNLIARAQDGDAAARETVIRAHMRLVVKAAYGLRPSTNLAFTSGGLELMDLIQEGMLGVDHALTKYKPQANSTFATYARHWIGHYMKRAIAEKESTIRFPVRTRQLIAQLHRLETQRSQQGFTIPLSDQEAAALLDVSETAVADARALSAIDVRGSLNARVGEDGASELQDLVADKDAIEPYDTLADYSPNQLRHALGRLKDREREILVQRYIEGKSSDAVGAELGVSGARVRKVEKRALGKLRRLLDGPSTAAASTSRDSTTHSRGMSI